MSNQTAQRVRRNGSPSSSATYSSTKQGPLKAVKAFSLKQGNYTPRSNASPPPKETQTPWVRKSPDNRNSPERKSPRSQQQSQQSPQQQSHPSINHLNQWAASCNVHSHSVLGVSVNQQGQVHKEKSKSSRRSPVPGKWRASSADTVVPSYLTGQWPKDINNYHHYQSSGVFMCDKSTQTVATWDGKLSKKKKVHRRSASFGQGDQFELHLIKQHLQKSKEGSKLGDGKQRSSPVPGNHSALSLTAPPALCSQTRAILISAGHIPRSNMKMNRHQRNSVEGLNTEIEKLVSSVRSVSVSTPEGDDYDLVFAKEIPDGHRAPVPELTRLSSTRSVDTQTPSGQFDPSGGQMSSKLVNSRPVSISPSTAFTSPRPGSSGGNRHSGSRSDSTDSKSSSKGDIEHSPDPLSSLPSPKLEKSCPFVREPPDGCEKVTVVEESRRPQIKEPMLFSPVKPNPFVFKQSQDSAFCPLIKKYGELTMPYSPVASPVLATGFDG